LKDGRPRMEALVVPILGEQTPFGIEVTGVRGEQQGGRCGSGVPLGGSCLRMVPGSLAGRAGSIVAGLGELDP
jgi:hypothetical protein